LIARRYKNQVIPLIFEDCRLERLAWSLRNKQYLDFRGRWAAPGRELVERVRAGGAVQT
jgi:hypothetical protein